VPLILGRKATASLGKFSLVNHPLDPPNAQFLAKVHLQSSKTRFCVLIPTFNPVEISTTNHIQDIPVKTRCYTAFGFITFEMPLHHNLEITTTLKMPQRKSKAGLRPCGPPSPPNSNGKRSKSSSKSKSKVNKATKAKSKGKSSSTTKVCVPLKGISKMVNGGAVGHLVRGDHQVRIYSGMCQALATAHRNRGHSKKSSPRLKTTNHIIFVGSRGWHSPRQRKSFLRFGGFSFAISHESTIISSGRCMGLAFRWRQGSGASRAYDGSERAGHVDGNERDIKSNC
jgi:hypothetical protein